MASKESNGKKRFPRLLSFSKRGKRIPLFFDKYGYSKCNLNRSEISELNERSNDIFQDASVTESATVSVSQQIVNAVVSSSIVTQHDLESTLGSASLSLNNSSAFAKYKSLKRSVSDVRKGILGKLKLRNRDHESTNADNAAESKLPNDSTKLVTSKLHKCSYRKEKHRSKAQNSIEQNNASMIISLEYSELEKYKHDNYKSFTKKEKTKKSASINNILSSSPNKVVQPDERISHQDSLRTEKPALNSSNSSCSTFEPESLQDLTESICQMSKALGASSVESIACICDCKNKNSTTVCCDNRKTHSPYNVVPEVIPDKVLGHQSSCDNCRSPPPSPSASTLKDEHIADNKDTCSVLSFKETNIGSISFFKDHLAGVHDNDDYCVDVNDGCCDEPTDNCHLWDGSDCSFGECSDLDCSCCDQTRSHSDTDDISVSSSDTCSDFISTTSESIQQCYDTLLASLPGKCPSKSCLSTSSFPQESVDAVDGTDRFDINMSPNSVSFRELDCDNGDVMYIDSSCAEQLKDIWSDSVQTLVHNKRYTSLCATLASSPVQKFSRHTMTRNNKDASWIGNHVDYLQNLDSSPEISLNDTISKTNICRDGTPWVKAEIGPSNFCRTVQYSANHSCQSIKGGPDLSVQSVDSSPTPLDLSQNNRINVCSNEICTNSAGNRTPTQNHVLPEVSCINRSQYTAASPECNFTITSAVNSAKTGSQYSSFHCHNNSFSCHTSSAYCTTSRNNFAGNKPKTYATCLNRSNSSFQCPKRTFSRGDSHYASFHGWSPMSPLDLSLNKTNTSLTCHKGRTGKWMEHVGQLYSPAKRVLHKNRGLSETDLCKQILDLYVSDAEESVFDASDGVEVDDLVISSCFMSLNGHEKIVDLGSHVDDSILQYGTYVGPRNVGKETNVDDFTTVVRSCYSGKAKTRRLQSGPSNDLVQGADKHSLTYQETLLKLQNQSRPDNSEVNEGIIYDQSKDVLPGATKTDKQGVSCQGLRDKTNTWLSSLELSCDKSFDHLTMLHTARNGKRKVRCLTLDESQNAITDYPPPKEATSISWGQTLSEMDLYRHSPRKTPIKTRPILAQKENNYPYEDSTPSPIVLTKMRKPKSFSKKYKNWPWT